MNAARLAQWDRYLRGLLVRLPPRLATRLYSRGRRDFLAAFTSQVPAPRRPPEAASCTCWGLHFGAPLGNAAGLFKNGQGYEVVAAQGAGFYLAGTTTGQPRTGNRRHGVVQPFAPYPQSGAASNWLGLPNEGHAAVAQRLARVPRVAGCPVGASVSVTPGDGQDDGAKLNDLIAGLRAYDASGVDFVELNESCPNTEDDAAGNEALAARLAAVQSRFLNQRSRPLPVVVKLSCDSPLALVPSLLDRLIEHGFDGVNFGNTSTDYARHRDAIRAAERPLFDDFTRRFGGGLSGRPLRQDALALVAAAAQHLKGRPVPHEFHIVATGGIESARHVAEARAAGASLCQWYTGYFESFGREGHAVYERLWPQLGA